MSQSLNIEKLVCGGSGVGFNDGLPVFVPLTAPGDEIEYSIGVKHKNYLEGILTKILKQSTVRTTPKCKYFGRCGGCQWQHLDYSAQILWKQIIVEEQLLRIGKIKGANVLPTIPSPKVWNYRNRIRLHKDANGKTGFYASGTNEIVEIDECLIAESFSTDIKDDDSFTQVNTCQNENLQKEVAALVKRSNPSSVLELYCGNGNLTFEIANLVENVMATDSNKESIALASKRVGKGKGLKFLCKSAQSTIKEFLQCRWHVDCLLIDPPRDGCKEILKGIEKLRPKTIIYVSCNPSTLARDLSFLIDVGYKLESVQPIDMFPQTFHIETISMLCR